MGAVGGFDYDLGHMPQTPYRTPALKEETVDPICFESKEERAIWVTFVNTALNHGYRPEQAAERADTAIREMRVRTPTRLLPEPR